MSDTFNPGKRSFRLVKYKHRNTKQCDAVSCRHTFGSTEKILRRNRRIWERLYAKIGRQIDKEEIVSGMSEYLFMYFHMSVKDILICISTIISVIVAIPLL